MASIAVTPLTEHAAIASVHARSLPQKNNLCGAFWGAVVLTAAGFGEADGEPVDQDLVALRAGTALPEGDPARFVPAGTAPRTDYRLPLPRVAAARSGTAVRPLAGAIAGLSRGALACVPVSGPWSGERLLALAGLAGEHGGVHAVLANVHTGPLWGTRPAAPLLLAHLAGATVTPPAPEWDTGHFLSLVAAVRGPGGALVVVGDTYPGLGWNGYHVQPPEALAAALVRGDGREGGILFVLDGPAEPELRTRLAAAGYELRFWDNGTPEREVED